MLYRKPLNSIEELRAERSRIIRDRQQLVAPKAKKQNASDELESSLLVNIQAVTERFLGESRYAPWVQGFGKLILPIILQKAAKKSAKMMAGKLFKEVLVGYVKWRAISFVLSYIQEQIQQKKGFKKKEAE